NEINNIGKQPQPQPQDISYKEDHIKQKVKEKNEACRIGNLITEITDAKTYEESFIPISGSYKNKVIEAKYDLNSKKVVY
ncbi:ATP-binding protein, partial [Francisella tularensis subsp. holarctica]|nr:ATP-binding protein [Francisella tularensis subsp. holarctica]